MHHPSARTVPHELTTDSEKKIDRIEDRLAGIENVLASLATKLGNLDVSRDAAESSSQSRSSRVGVSNRSPGSMAEAATPAPFEGETTINRQSDYARDLLAQAVGRTPSIVQNAEIKSALTALGELVSQQGQNTLSPHPLINRDFAEWNPAKLEKPPWEEISNALDKATSKCAVRLALFNIDCGRVSYYGVCCHIPFPQDEKLERDLRGSIPQCRHLQRTPAPPSLRSHGEHFY